MNDPLAPREAHIIFTGLRIITIATFLAFMW